MKYMTYPRASAFLTEELGVPIAEATLRRMVSKRRVPFVKMDKRVLFESERLAAWLRERAVEPKK